MMDHRHLLWNTHGFDEYAKGDHQLIQSHTKTKFSKFNQKYVLFYYKSGDMGFVKFLICKVGWDKMKQVSKKNNFSPLFGFNFGSGIE